MFIVLCILIVTILTLSKQSGPQSIVLGRRAELLGRAHLLNQDLVRRLQRRFLRRVRAGTCEGLWQRRGHRDPATR
jgi:hypothetical protein